MPVLVCDIRQQKATQNSRAIALEEALRNRGLKEIIYTSHIVLANGDLSLRECDQQRRL